MNFDRVLTVGDSWASAYVNGVNDAGWPSILGIPPAMRQAEAGSTASQWAANYNNWLTTAANTSADVVVISLLGNDVFAALSDGVVTPHEISEGVSNLAKVISIVRKPRTIVFLYTNPFKGRSAEESARGDIICALLNGAIRMACGVGGGILNTISLFDTGLVLQPQHFDGKDIHPNQEGQEMIATALKIILNEDILRGLR